MIPLGEIDRDNALSLLNEWLDGRVEIVLPKLWLFEVSNVLMLKNPERSLEIMNIFIGYSFLECETTLELCSETFKLMKKHDVTFYDAVYHAVAILRNGILLTADDAYCKRVSGITNVVRFTEWR